MDWIKVPSTGEDKEIYFVKIKSRVPKSIVNLVYVKSKGVQQAKFTTSMPAFQDIQKSSVKDFPRKNILIKTIFEKLF